MASHEKSVLISGTSGSDTFPHAPVPSYTWAGELEEEDALPKTGTVISSAMNLAACALGASMLSLPYAMMVSGPIVSYSLLTFFAIASYYAAQFIVSAGLKSTMSTYSKIVEFYLGKSHALFCDILLSCALAVAAISYIVGLRDMMPNLIPAFSNIPPLYRVIGLLSLLFPVTLISNLSAFGSASTFAAFGCYFQAGALVLQLLLGSTKPAVGPSLLSKLAMVDVGGVIFSLPMVCFVFAFHYVLTDTLCEVSNPTSERLASVNRTATAILMGCYIPVSIAGYLLVTGRCTKTNLLECLPSGSPAVAVANWSIGLLLFITYSLFLIPLRRKLEEVVFGEQTATMLDIRRLVVAATLALTIGLISVTLRDLGLANTLAGGCIALVMFFYPGALRFSQQYDVPIAQRKTVQLVVGVVYMILGVVICLSGLFGNIVFREQLLGELPFQFEDSGA